MKSKLFCLIAGAGAAGGMLAGCGSDHHAASMPPPPPAMTTELDTLAVLSIVQTKTSETAPPFEVDNGAVAVTPVGDETSPPLPVDST
jgi:hypothetical protein